MRPLPRRLVPMFVLAVLVAANLLGGVVENVEPQRGRSVAQINWTDESGGTRQLSEFAGYPVILLPIYTRCRTACIDNVAQLKKALADSFADPRQFRVLLFSFDATDTPLTLAQYRTRESIPLSWSTAAGSQANIDTLLKSIGFQVGKAGTEFVHANLLVFLDPKLRVAKWIYGTDYSGGDVDSALKVASGGNDWVGKHSEWLYAVLLFAGSLLCVALSYSLVQLRLMRRATRNDAADRSVALDSLRL
jgi:cytochrome oxidase Cu insertion factor (SCO1/SenC/PrrC family)